MLSFLQTFFLWLLPTKCPLQYCANHSFVVVLRRQSRLQLSSCPFSPFLFTKLNRQVTSPLSVFFVAHLAQTSLKQPQFWHWNIHTYNTHLFFYSCGRIGAHCSLLVWLLYSDRSKLRLVPLYARSPPSKTETRRLIIEIWTYAFYELSASFQSDLTFSTMKWSKLTFSLEKILVCKTGRHHNSEHVFLTHSTLINSWNLT